MATIYVDSNAAGLNNGSSWTDAYTTWQAALTAYTPGTDVIWMEKAHNEVFSLNTTFTCAGTSASNPVIVVSVDKTDDSYAPNGGTWQLDNSTDWNIFYLNFSLITYGLSIKCNRQLRMAISGARYKHINPTFGTSPAAPASLGNHYFGVANQMLSVEYVNPTFDLAGDFYFLGIGGMFKIYGGSITNTYDNAGTGIFHTTDAVQVEAYGFDMSGFTGADAIFSGSLSLRAAHNKLYNCALPTGVPISGSAFAQPDSVQAIYGCDSSTSYERTETHLTAGNVITTNSVYLDSSSSEYISGNQYSFEFTPSSTCTIHEPLFHEFLASIVTTTGSKTFTFEIVHDFTTALTDADFHVEIYSGETASSTTAVFSSSAPNGVRNPLTTGTTLTTSTAAWTGASGLTKQKITKTITVNRKGPVFVKAYLNKYEAGKSAYLSREIGIA